MLPLGCSADLLGEYVQRLRDSQESGKYTYQNWPIWGFWKVYLPESPQRPNGRALGVVRERRSRSQFLGAHPYPRLLRLESRLSAVIFWTGLPWATSD
jgi:hypothetical protein